tara:strand:+ start:136 stop:552 length:417 start_codon:yes stop_codon:yes gene_type:complete
MSKLIKKVNLICAFKNSFDACGTYKTSSAILSDLHVPKTIANSFIMLSRNKENLTINVDLMYNKEKYMDITKHVTKLENNIFLSYDHKFNNIYYDNYGFFDKDIEDVLKKVEEYFRQNKKLENDDFFIKNVSIYFEKK